MYLASICHYWTRFFLHPSFVPSILSPCWQFLKKSTSTKSFISSSLASCFSTTPSQSYAPELNRPYLTVTQFFSISLLPQVLYNMFDCYVGMGLNNIQYTDVLSGCASFFVVALGGTLIGIVWGFATGFVSRFTNHVCVIEPIFIFIMSYLAYLNAEIFHMSGILA